MTGWRGGLLGQPHSREVSHVAHKQMLVAGIQNTTVKPRSQDMNEFSLLDFISSVILMRAGHGAGAKTLSY